MIREMQVHYRALANCQALEQVYRLMHGVQKFRVSPTLNRPIFGLIGQPIAVWLLGDAIAENGVESTCADDIHASSDQRLAFLARKLRTRSWAAGFAKQSRKFSEASRSYSILRRGEIRFRNALVLLRASAGIEASLVANSSTRDNN